VIEPEPVDRAADPRQIARLLPGLDDRGQRLGVAGELLRVGKGLVPVGGKPLGRRLVLRGVARGQHRLPVVDGAEQGRGDQRAQHVDRCAVPQVDVMDRPQQQRRIGDTGCVTAQRISEQGEHRGLVEGRKPVDPIAVAPRHQGGVIGKPAGAVTNGPAAEIVEILRQIPVIQAEPGLDSRRQQRVDEAVIECQPRLVGVTAAVRQDARPGDRKPIGVDAEIAHQRNVLGPTMVMIAGGVAGIAVGDAPDLAAKGVPDAGASTVFTHGAFDLVARCRDAPDEPVAAVGRRGCFNRGR